MKNAKTKDESSATVEAANADLIDEDGSAAEVANANPSDEDGSAAEVASADENTEGGGAAEAASEDPHDKGCDASNAGFEDMLKAERNKYLRLAAEYDNYRKRSAREREQTYNDARTDTITSLLPIYDNLERALKMECEDEAFYKGIEMTMTALVEILENMGVTQIPAIGEPFDPNRHNAVMSVENPELGEKVVSDEFQKGFTLGERVIRFSNVVVAN